nr:Chain B, 9-mer peptide [synthetic construct]
DLENLYFQG